MGPDVSICNINPSKLYDISPPTCSRAEFDDNKKHESDRRDNPEKYGVCFLMFTSNIFKLLRNDFLSSILHSLVSWDGIILLFNSRQIGPGWRSAGQGCNQIVITWSVAGPLINVNVRCLTHQDPGAISARIFSLLTSGAEL